ncbi:MAG: Rne/Rng family ribonuclease, partial [Alphaproteobacteria bacterium]|nr:Rne/Rng family ribonuclease [Alphaproteobacteria bacterium]
FPYDDRFADDDARQSQRGQSYAETNNDQDSSDGFDDDATEDAVEYISDEPSDTPSPSTGPAHRLHNKYKIQEVLRTGQVMLVQVLKEARGTKGASLTTFISLSGRNCILMPNSASKGGISKKITDTATRKRLKNVYTDLNVPADMSLIIRTAGQSRAQSEFERDYTLLQERWDEIRQRTVQSKAPARVYKEPNLLERCVRDYYEHDMTDVIVEGKTAYATVRSHMETLLPTHTRKIAQHDGSFPLFASAGVEMQLASAFHNRVDLPSGGHLVFTQTEALVAVDVNSGRANQKRFAEDTAFSTNLEAANEIARQLRLRDLAGLLVIDFIDMNLRKNQRRIERTFKEALEKDKARISLGGISSFGLLEMTRQRLTPSLNEFETRVCPNCFGTGTTMSAEGFSNFIIRGILQLISIKRYQLRLNLNPVTAFAFLNYARTTVTDMERQYGFSLEIIPLLTLTENDYLLYALATIHDQGKVTPLKTPLQLKFFEPDFNSNGKGRKKERSKSGRSATTRQHGEREIAPRFPFQSDTVSDESQGVPSSDHSMPHGNDTASDARSDARSDDKQGDLAAEDRALHATGSQATSENLRTVTESGDEKPRSSTTQKPRTRRKKTDTAIANEAVNETTTDAPTPDATAETPPAKKKRQRAASAKKREELETDSPVESSVELATAAMASPSAADALDESATRSKPSKPSNPRKKKAEVADLTAEENEAAAAEPKKRAPRKSRAKKETAVESADADSATPSSSPARLGETSTASSEAPASVSAETAKKTPTKRPATRAKAKNETSPEEVASSDETVAQATPAKKTVRRRPAAKKPADES